MNEMCIINILCDLLWTMRILRGFFILVLQLTTGESVVTTLKKPLFDATLSQNLLINFVRSSCNQRGAVALFRQTLCPFRHD